MTKQDEKFFNIARKNALESDFNRIHIGCVAVCKGKVIATGFNCNKTHPEQKVYNEYRRLYDEANVKHSMHAEMMCLNRLGEDFQKNKIKLYIYRIRNDIPHGMCRPCAACMQRIRNMGIKNIYYTTDEGFAHEEII